MTHTTVMWSRCILCGTEYSQVFDADSARSRDEAEELLQRKIERCCK